MNTQAGKHFGRYRLDEAVGRGGMAEVYRAWDEKLERTVAVKIILPGFATDPELRDRFQREARLVASLEHPHILPVFDFGEADGLPYLVMPYLDGGTLASRFDGTPLARHEVCEIVRQLGGALDAAHAAGVLHRDVKPSNVLVAGDGRLVLADFGIAKLFDSSTRLTQTGAMVGTPVFMAPEIARGEPATAASDLYSLACLAFQLLTGEPPFRGENALSLLHQHVHDPVPSIRARRPELEPELEAVLHRALAKDPRERPPSGAALAQALAGAEATVPLVATGSEPFAGASGPAASLLSVAPRGEGGGRRPAGWLVAFVVAIGVAAAALWLVSTSRSHPDAAAGTAQEAPPITATDAGPGAATGPASAAAESALEARGSVVEPSAASSVEGSEEAGGSPDPGLSTSRAASPPPRGSAAASAPSPVRSPEELWLRGRPSCATFGRLEERLDRAPDGADGAEARRLLSTWAAAGVAYCEGDREAARNLLEEMPSLAADVRQGSSPQAALRLLRPGAIPDWQLVLALGDPRREAAALLDELESGPDAVPAVELARSLLAHLDGDHAEAARRARLLLESSDGLRLQRPEIAALAVEEMLHAGDLDRALSLLPELGGDPQSIRRVVRSLELGGGVEALRRVCAAGWRPACLAARRRR